jgi:hypothetical protein
MIYSLMSETDTTGTLLEGANTVSVKQMKHAKLKSDSTVNVIVSTVEMECITLPVRFRSFPRTTLTVQWIVEHQHLRGPSTVPSLDGSFQCGHHDWFEDRVGMRRFPFPFFRCNCRGERRVRGEACEKDSIANSSFCTPGQMIVVVVLVRRESNII